MQYATHVDWVDRLGVARSIAIDLTHAKTAPNCGRLQRGGPGHTWLSPCWLSPTGRQPRGANDAACLLQGPKQADMLALAPLQHPGVPCDFSILCGVGVHTAAAGSLGLFSAHGIEGPRVLL